MSDGIRQSVAKRTCMAFVPMPPEPVLCTESERCRGCPYPAHGVICWHRDGGCLRTEMYYNATRKGTIDTIPEVPGLAVWKSGHIGVYIGGGQVIEAMGTKYGVVKTQLQGRGWTHWLEIPYINYD